MISVQDYFAVMAKLKQTPSPEVEENAVLLLEKVNRFISYLFEEKYLPADFKIVLNSGWRSLEYNDQLRKLRQAKTACHSLHCVGHAVDIGSRVIIDICTKRPSLLEKFGLYAESGIDTPNWSHLQDLPPKSGLRIFRA